jgi:hypothetical protein
MKDEVLTKDEKPIRLKDVIKRIKGFDDGTKFKWTYDILRELGSDFGSKIFHEAYQQGRFYESIETHYKPQKVVVPQFVADWYEENKGDFETSLFQCVYEIFKKRNDSELNEFEIWVIDENIKPFQTLVNMHQFGYEVEKEKRYLVKLKAVDQYLVSVKDEDFLGFLQSRLRSKFTRKELEDANLGWVFDCPGIEIEEVDLCH